MEPIIVKLSANGSIEEDKTILRNGIVESQKQNLKKSPIVVVNRTTQLSELFRPVDRAASPETKAESPGPETKAESPGPETKAESPGPETKAESPGPETKASPDTKKQQLLTVSKPRSPTPFPARVWK
jgi:hypothetical protein